VSERPAAGAAAAAGEAGAKRKLDTILARVADYMPSDAERVELYRWVDALGVHDNDAILMVAAFVAKHNWALSKVPGRLEEAGERFVAKTVKNVERVADDAAEKAIVGKLKKVRPGIQQAVTDAIAAAAKEVAKTQTQVSQVVVGLWLAGISAIFAGLFMVCGWELARGQLPFWMSRRAAEQGSGLAKVAGAVLGAPAGYWALLCGFAAVVLLLKKRWDRLQLAVAVTPKERWTNIGFFALAVGGWLACAVLMAMVVGSPLR
jgi:hypothetical protein